MLVMMVVSIGTSTLYFMLSPLKEATPEITARTIPSIWDVVIALFGGLAGIIATATKEKGNVIPGVAIATALMPPLCTAGFGIATGNWLYFGGALYLFFINAVFVSLATLFMVRFLRFRKKEFVDAIREKKVKNYITFVVLLTALPSIYIAYNIVKKTVYFNNVDNFVAQEFNFPNTKVISQKLSLDTAGEKVLEVFLIGEHIQPQTIENIKNQLTYYNIYDCELVVKQGIKEAKDINIDELKAGVKTGLVEELYQKNAEILKSKEERILLLEEELIKVTGNKLPIDDISKEFCSLNKNVEHFTVQPSIIYNNKFGRLDTMIISYVQYKKLPSKREQEKLYNWLKVRTKADSLLMINK